MNRLVALTSLAALAASAACGDAGTAALTPLNLDRPVDIAFACWGGLRIVGDDSSVPPDGDPVDLDDPLVFSAQPMESCRIRSVWVEDDADQMRPEGQEDIEGPDDMTTSDDVRVGLVEYYGFVLQSAPGTVGLARFPTLPAERYTGADVALFDADQLTPGRNSIVVGALPIAIEADSAGCHMITANAGSCDLSVFEVGSFVDDDVSTPAQVRTLIVSNAADEDVFARPADMVAQPTEADQPIGVECPADPAGLVYVAYPDCHLVAAVRASTGRIEAGIQFDETGVVTITDGNVSCPAQCGGGGSFVVGERPVALDLVHDARVDTRRLVIGAEDSPILTVVELGADYLPTSFSRVTLEGELGVIDVALTPQIGMGGSSGVIDDTGAAGGQHQFVYAVATDATVRVADVLGGNVECDTQVDPRYLRGVTDVGLLSCLPVGDVATPPRRVTAQGPGIEFPDRAVPLAVTIVPVEQRVEGVLTPPDPPASAQLVGYFGFVTTATGSTFILNVDDDAYGDLWDPANPLGTMIPDIVAHQIRDGVDNRGDIARDEEGVSHCGEGINGSGGPRIDGFNPIVTQEIARLSARKSFVLADVRRLPCEDERADTPEHIPELAFAAPLAQRELAFPDLRALPSSETWFATWEGALSRDDSSEAIDGPVTRLGLVERDGNSLVIRDGTRPFCAMGAEPRDVAVLAGCDPNEGDAQCGVGQICYGHPDATVATGACLPEADATVLAGACRDFLISLRRYAITSTSAGELRLVPRRRMLPTTPVDGCVSDTQCQDLALLEARLASVDRIDTAQDEEHPIHDPTAAPERTYSCEADPTRGGVDRCLMVCEDSTDCDDGTRCSGGYCVEGVVPDAECLPGVQRYQVRGGDSLVVVGSISGYLHSIIEEPGTGACVLDPAAHPLMTGRIRLDAPPCPGPDALDALTPNPCTTTVEHTTVEPAYTYDPESNTCTGDTDDSDDLITALVTRDAPAIRFKNPMFTFNLVDPWYPGDEFCLGDRAAGFGKVPVLRTGFGLQIPLISGFSAERVQAPAVFPINVVRGPEDSIWVLDEGDNVPDFLDGSSTRGQVFRVEPSKLNTINTVQ